MKQYQKIKNLEKFSENHSWIKIYLLLINLMYKNRKEVSTSI
jgi:hypothetical protein